MPLIKLEDLNVTYLNKKTGTEIPVFSSLNLVIPDKRITVILGASGSGKTTLLNVIAGLHSSYKGKVYFDNEDASFLTIRDKDLSYVKQDSWLYPLKSIFDNIAFPLKFYDLEKPEVYSRVRDIAKKMGLEACLTRRPKHLSLGQQKRVALAKALIKEPSLILFDEPLTGLDPIKKDELLTLIKDSIKEVNGTAIYVTHDVSEALKIADHLIVLGENCLVFEGTPKQMMASDNEFVKALTQSLSFKVEE